MNCFHLPINIDAEVTHFQPSIHHSCKHSAEGKVSSGQLIRNCLSQITPDQPEQAIAAAKVMQCALREITNTERVRRSLAEFYGVNYLLTSLNQAIDTYEKESRIDELLFIAMRIGRELAPNSIDFSVSVDRLT